MSKFDDTVNYILYKQLLEQVAPDQTSDNFNIEEELKKIQKEKENIQKYIETNQEEWQQETAQKTSEIENLGSVMVDKIENAITENLQNLKKKVDDKTLEEGALPQSIQDGLTWIKGLAKDTYEWSKNKLESFVDNYLIGWIGEFVENSVGEDVTTYVNNELSEHWLYKIMAVLDFTGIMSWPYVADAARLYDQNKNNPDKENIYALNLLAAVVAATPGVNGLAILALPFRILTWSVGTPLRSLLGISRMERLANQTSSKMLEAMGKSGIAGKAERLLSSGRFGGRTVELLRSIFGKAAKLGASAAKVGTIASSGDVPKMLDDLIQKGKGLMNQKFTSSPLGQFSSFPEFRTN